MEQQDDELLPTAELPESSRVEAFSDGVLAIALTLLVLDLHSDAARSHFGRELASQWSSYIAYLAAFLNISAIWINHHDLFIRVRSVDARLVAVNLLVLLVASLFPWPAAVVSAAIRDGTHHDQVIAITLYAGVGFLVPWTFIGLYSYLTHHPALLRRPTDVAYTRAGVRRSSVSIVLYPIAVLVGLVEPKATLVIFVAMPAFFIGTLLLPRRNGPAKS